ncbi:hypothetical protein BG452_13115 [Streptomyces sp. CBMA123]|nr:hypothetical protein [Streptomyces sp. CBMA123]
MRAVTPCSRSGPTCQPWAAQWSRSWGRAPRADRQAAGAEVQSESCSSTVPPPYRSAVTVRWTVSGVARLVQSSPQLVHSTGVRPRRRADRWAAVLMTPYGGRNHCGARPLSSAMVSRARRRSWWVARGPRSSSGRCAQPWTAISWPASAISRTRAGVRSAIEPSRKKVARTSYFCRSVRKEGVEYGSGPSSKVRAMWSGRPVPARRGSRRLRSGP